jgi:hypothetical protein
MNETTLKDFRGTPITVGCRILYPCRASSSVWMNEAEVKEIETVKAPLPYSGRDRLRLKVVPIRSSDTYTKFTGKATWIECVNRVAVVQ